MGRVEKGKTVVRKYCIRAESIFIFKKKHWKCLTGKQVYIGSKEAKDQQRKKSNSKKSLAYHL